MPLPLSINLTVALHLFRSHLKKGNSHIPLVLMLELTHACNLNCSGCGRIREYADTKNARLTYEQAISAIQEADLPVLSISGGEPLLHPDAPHIARSALELGKVVYLCTNGMLLTRRLKEFTPHRRFYFNVHLDGTPKIHDQRTGLAGSAEKAIQVIVAAKAAGFGVTTNTTIYRDTKVEDTIALFQRLTELGVDGMMIAPAFNYQVGVPAGTLTRAEAQAWMREFSSVWYDRNMYHTPLYMQFLRGERQVACNPWGTVTYNPQGWKKPCYLLTDDHVPSFSRLMEQTNWGAYGPGRDPRCTDCMLHSGFEPAIMGSLQGPGDWWQLLRWQLSG